MDTFEWEDLVKHYEIISSTGANIQKFVNGRPNVLVGNFQHVEANRWTALEYVPTEMSSEAVIADFMHWDDCKPCGTISLIWDVKHVKPAKHAMYFGLDAYRADITEFGFDYLFDASTTILPVQKKTDDMMKVLSLYGGGFGGWAFAVTHLNAYHGIPTQHIAVESNMEACISFAVQHDVPVLNGYYDIPFKRFQGNFKGCVIHGNAVSTQWMTPVAQWGPNVVTISAPCPPWSQASKGKGLATPEGMLLPESILHARLFQPDVICLETGHGIQLTPPEKTCHENHFHVWICNFLESMC